MYFSFGYCYWLLLKSLCLFTLFFYIWGVRTQLSWKNRKEKHFRKLKKRQWAEQQTHCTLLANKICLPEQANSHVFWIRHTQNFIHSVTWFAGYTEMKSFVSKDSWLLILEKAHCRRSLGPYWELAGWLRYIKPRALTRQSSFYVRWTTYGQASHTGHDGDKVITMTLPEKGVWIDEWKNIKGGGGVMDLQIFIASLWALALHESELLSWILNPSFHKYGLMLPSAAISHRRELRI